MSSSNESLPITPQAFAAALEDLPPSALHLKVLEIYNSIAHLKYSNEQLRPFAEGLEAPLGYESTQQNQPDPDCVEAIRENEEVIVRMEERVQLIKNEVERRGLSWTEFERKEEVEAAAARNRARGPVETGEDSENEEEQHQQPMTNGTSTTATTAQHPAWTDGTFQTGVIRNGETVMDDVAGSRRGQEQQGANATGAGAGGSLSDEELRRRMEERMRNLGGDDDEDGGMHL
ncbi:hypothetical protein B0T20DRAFT_231794 [Sordaria brevicollis]|uniref:Uncharacterized protein n=1 Tax=Sordaria brevicollis TaxID=83679 RepID=A0AAE0PD50_SORBR|nr:hypothetical protein B0T20DRAFT_231794 [Sordaria brevicollis]